ncbi:hypothetical protein ACWCPM_18705 [Streptomyces sp. NPDC002309]
MATSPSVLPDADLRTMAQEDAVSRLLMIKTPQGAAGPESSIP